MCLDQWKVSNLVFYAQSTITVISHQGNVQWKNGMQNNSVSLSILLLVMVLTVISSGYCSDRYTGCVSTGK